MTTPRELITGALRLINVVQANENPTADDMDISFEALNAMLDSWSTEKLSIFSMNPYEFNFIAGQKEYTLGPSGDWEIPRPMELLMMYVMYLDGGGECPIPVPPPLSCSWPSSVQDAFTTDLWHFDEELGSLSVTPTVENYDNFTPKVLDPAYWSLQPACCTNGLKDTPVDPFSANTGITFLDPYGNDDTPTPAAATIEFVVLNDGYSNPSAYDYSEVFRADMIAYGGGEGLGIIRGFKDQQTLIICKDSDVGSPLATLPLPIDTCTSVALQVSWPGDVFSIAQDGVVVLSTTVNAIWAPYGGTSVNASLTFFSQGYAYSPLLIVDELQRSTTIRYT